MKQITNIDWDYLYEEFRDNRLEELEEKQEQAKEDMSNIFLHKPKADKIKQEMSDFVEGLK